ncbi:hypothetical protein ACB092_07G085100 [Castanea dentata]
MIEVFQEFCNLPEEEKQEFHGNHVMDPIRCGTGFNPSTDKVNLRRDHLKFYTYPEFHSPNKPVGFSEIALELSKRNREVAIVILKAISKSLGLEESYIDKASNFKLGLQIVAANFYPACPEPERAIGIPPHSDHGLLTLLVDNGISGLQIKHKGKWINVNLLPNALFAHIGDHLEILSNGKYKGVLHQALANDKATRISIAMPHGPSLDTVIRPAPEFVDNESHPPKYIEITYKEYVELLLSGKIYSKFREIALEFSKRNRGVVTVLLKAISKSLGLEERYINKAADFELGLQLPAANYYPACPEPEKAIGIPAHYDHGLLTTLVNNGVSGLQVTHKEKWFNVHIPANVLFVQVADHLEILSNGMYKSIEHRALVNDKATRMSIALAHGPSLDTIIRLAPELVDSKSHPPAYVQITYKAFLELQQTGKLRDKFG